MCACVVCVLLFAARLGRFWKQFSTRWQLHMYLLTYGIRIRSEDSNEPNEWKNRKIITETHEQEKESESG